MSLVLCGVVGGDRPPSGGSAGRGGVVVIATVKRRCGLLQPANCHRRGKVRRAKWESPDRITGARVAESKLRQTSVPGTREDQEPDPGEAEQRRSAVGLGAVLHA